MSLKKRTVLGLDLSITSSGMVWLRGRSDQRFKVLGYRNPRTTLADGNDHQRIRHIITELMKGIDQHEPGLVVIERYALSKFTNQSRLGELGGIVRWELTANGIPWCDKPPGNTIKKFATGNGRADKALMLDSARDWWSECPSVRPGQDVADAFHIARIGLCHYFEYLEIGSWS